MIRTLIAMALALTLGLAAMPTMARDVPPTPTQTTCDKLETSIESAAAQSFVPNATRAAYLTASLENCPGLRESLSATAQAWLDQHGI